MSQDTIGAYTDVQPDAVLEFGVAPAHGEGRRTMKIVGVPPEGADNIAFSSNCLRPPVDALAIVFDDRCGMTAEVGLWATDTVGGTTGTVLVSYIYLPAVTIVDGGPYAPYNRKNVPLAGTLLIQGTTHGGSDFMISVPATSSTIDIDLDEVLPPSVMATLGADDVVQWSVADDGGGARVIHAMASDYTWTHEYSPTIETMLHMRVVSPPTTTGVLASPRFPEPLAEYQPIPPHFPPQGSLVRVSGIDADRAKFIARVGSQLVPLWALPQLSTLQAWSIGFTHIYPY